MTKSNIQGGFRGAGLILYNPEYIILQLDIKLYISISPRSLSGPPLPWELKTLYNPTKAQS